MLSSIPELLLVFVCPVLHGLCWPHLRRLIEDRCTHEDLWRIPADGFVDRVARGAL